MTLTSNLILTSRQFTVSFPPLVAGFDFSLVSLLRLSQTEKPCDPAIAQVSVSNSRDQS